MEHAERFSRTKPGLRYIFFCAVFTGKYLYLTPQLDPLHADPRFPGLLRKLGLPA